MVKIVKIEPHSSVVKECICGKCGATLQYTPIEVSEVYIRDYTGGGETYNFINCPNCASRVYVKN
jgi:hypothetical protein